MALRHAEFRFYAELNDFLPRTHRFATVTRAFEGEASVKDMIEALGVPHTEVDLIIVDGTSVDFTYRVRDGDRVAVYPVFEAFDIGPLAAVRSAPLREPRFAADAHLGTLARHLRLLGFDTAYDRNWEDAALAAMAHADHRIVLTRDVGLLKRNLVTHGLFVRAQQPRAQLLEIARRLQLASRFRPFTRCLKCNGILTAVAKEDIVDAVPERALRVHDAFVRCSACASVYWAARITHVSSRSSKTSGPPSAPADEPGPRTRSFRPSVRRIGAGTGASGDGRGPLINRLIIHPASSPTQDMLKIEQHHSGWRVVRDGDPVADAECPSGSHTGFQSAVRQAIRVREEGERIESRTWHKRHDNGWLSRLTVTADGRIEWGSHDGPAWSIQLTPADDIDEAERRANEAANRQGRHSCSEHCGRWWLST